MSTFPTVADYAFLSNCEQSCLVAPDGSVEWLCLPRPDSPSVFGALLDRTAGQFRFGPTNLGVPHNRRYVPGTMVLETTWHTPTGWLVIHDLLVMDRTGVPHSRAGSRRAPADFSATGVLLRTATCISGQAEVMVDCAPLFNYGTIEGTWAYQGEGYECMTITPKGGGVRLDVAGSIRLGIFGVRLYGHTTLTKGESAYITLSWDGGPMAGAV
jgi:GH15 family glucan-1,4-alpha-glucosidase